MLITAKYFLKHAGQPKRVWQGHNTSVGREDLLVPIIASFIKPRLSPRHFCIYIRPNLELNPGKPILSPSCCIRSLDPPKKSTAAAVLHGGQP